MAVTEMLLGERAEHGLESGIAYDPKPGLIRGVVNGATDTEPITVLRERFAKLKARGELLGSVADRLHAREFEVYSEVGRLLDEREALAEIAKGLGLDTLAAHALPAQVLAMNTELTAALAKAQERVKELEGDAEDHEAAWGEIEEFLCIGEHSDGVITTIKKMQARLSSLEAPPLGWVQKKIAKVGALVGLEGADLDALHQGVKAALSSSQAEAARLREQIGGMADLMERERASHALAREEASCQFVGRMNSAEAEAKALAQENAILRSGVELERNEKLSAMTAADIAISRSAELEAEVRILKSKATEADLERIMATASAAGMRAAVNFMEHTLREKLRT